MDKNYDAQKVIEYLFDPEVSEILSELESEEKEAEYLSSKFKITEEEIRTRLSYLIQYEFVRAYLKNGKIFYSADGGKLAKVLETTQDFKNIDDGLAKMDSFLN